MNVTRKDFLALAAAGAATAALSPGELLGAGNGTAYLSAQLKNAVGQTFRVQGGSRNAVDMVLQSFVDRPDSKTTQFSLVFAAPDGARLAEGTYAMTNKTLGAMSMFVTPTGTSGGRANYRADFNLLPTTIRK